MEVKCILKHHQQAIMFNLKYLLGTTLSINYLTRWGYIKPASKEKMQVFYQNRKDEFTKQQDVFRRRLKQHRSDLKKRMTFGKKKIKKWDTPIICILWKLYDSLLCYDDMRLYIVNSLKTKMNGWVWFFHRNSICL